MPFVIRPEIVARSLKRLREQKTHTLFPGYLHLQQKAAHLGRFSDLQPDFVAFYKDFLRVGEHPLGSPYLKFFTEQKPSAANLWLNSNVAGSYAPSSLRPNQPFRRVVEIDSSRVYSLPINHASRALEALLFNKRISAVDLSVVLYRDFGFLKDISISDLVGIFAYEFGYCVSEGIAPNNDFETLYTKDEMLNWPIEWLHIAEKQKAQPVFSVFRASGIRTTEKVRELTSEQLLFEPNQATEIGFPAQIRSLTAQNILSFGEGTTFEFGNLNVLLGPNGSGKSNLLDCIRILRYSPFNIQEAWSEAGLEEWIYKGDAEQTNQAALSAIVTVPGISYPLSHELRFRSASNGSAILQEAISSTVINEDLDEILGELFFLGAPSLASLAIHGSGKKRRMRRMAEDEYTPTQSILSQVRNVADYPEITRLATFYKEFRLYTEWSFGRNSMLRQPSKNGGAGGSLSETMSDLALVLNGLQGSQAHEKIRELLAELKETYLDFNTRALFGQINLEIIEKFALESPIPANRLSDGTLRFLALASILLNPTPPPLICLEEPELGMHPDMIRMLAGMITKAKSKTQLIITTHSELLLTALQDEIDALFAFNADEDGSFVRRYSTQEFEVWREEHNLGELWTTGELGGNRW